MSKQTHRYLIEINGGSKKGRIFSCTYDRTKDILLRIGRQKAGISFQMTVSMQNDKLIGEQRIFYNLLSKTYLLHVLITGQSLQIKTIRITIDEEVKDYNKTNSAGFPFVHSLLSPSVYDLDPPYLNEGIRSAICTLPQSKANTDRRMIALLSFLRSYNRPFEIDQFTALWTAMNAYYNHVAVCFESGIKRKQGGEDRRLQKCLQLAGKDGLSIGAMCWLLKERYRPITAEKSKKLFPKYSAVERLLAKYTDEQIERLYDESYQNLKDGSPMSGFFLELSEETAAFGVPVFSFLLLGYPYYRRCKYLHGNQAPALFLSFNSPELRSLHAINYFLRRYLKKNIPNLFGADFWTDAKTESIVEFMSRYSDGAKKKIERNEWFLP